VNAPRSYRCSIAKNRSTVTVREIGIKKRCRILFLGSNPIIPPKAVISCALQSGPALALHEKDMEILEEELPVKFSHRGCRQVVNFVKVTRFSVAYISTQGKL
jgi:hypothetical protein